MSEHGRGSNLVRRVAVGVVAVPGFLFLAWVGGLAFVALVTAEWYLRRGWQLQ